MNKTYGSGLRNGTIDTAKSFLIFAIYLFHYGTAAGGLYDFFATFHVPAFFMISGFWALNRTERSIGHFIINAVKKYLLLWLIWVLLYTAYFSWIYHYKWENTKEIFTRYFLAVRGSGIAGMWFVPAFFLVTLVYFVLAKATRRMTGRSPLLQAAWLFGVCLVGYLAITHWIPLPHGLWFSLNQVPLHLYYYALGTLLFTAWEKLSSSKGKTVWSYVGGVIALLYSGLVYWHWDDQLFAQIRPDGYLAILPATLAVLAGLGGCLFVAKWIACKPLIAVGKATLGLCLCELLVKQVLVRALADRGITLTVTPFWAVAFTLITLAAGTLLVVPVTAGATSMIWRLFAPKTKKK